MSPCGRDVIPGMVSRVDGAGRSTVTSSSGAGARPVPMADMCIIAFPLTLFSKNHFFLIYRLSTDIVSGKAITVRIDETASVERSHLYRAMSAPWAGISGQS